MKRILQSYLKRLTNLSATNKSLVLLRLAAERFIDLHDFNYLFKNNSFEIVSNLIAKKDRFTICNFADSRDESSNLMSKKLKRLTMTLPILGLNHTNRKVTQFQRKPQELRRTSLKTNHKTSRLSLRNQRG